MSLLTAAAILLSLAGVFAWVNERFFKLPTTIGLMILALVNSLLVLCLQFIAPAWAEPAERMIASVDFNKTLMHGMLGYLLFAGALHVDLGKLKDQTAVVLLLATAGVLLTTGLVGLAAWGVTRALGLQVPWVYCLLFGALLAPTDPIAVLAILKKIGAPKSIELKLTGESLFNDGIGVVIFLGLMGLAGHGGAHDKQVSQQKTNDTSHDMIEQAAGVGELFLVEVGGGIFVGLLLGGLTLLMMRSIDEYRTEVLITLATVTAGYVLCTALHFSGPLAMVVAGLFIGNTGPSAAMSETTTQRVDEFWELIDEILNAVLFVMIGLEVLIVALEPTYVVAGLAVIPLALLARYISVGGVVLLLRSKRQFTTGAVPFLAWAGLRGGISVALALSLKGKLSGDLSVVGDLLVTMTYVVVCFSIIVQGLTVAPLMRKLGITSRA